MEEPSKKFVHFLYNLFPLFHMKVFKIPFFNSQLFPLANDPFLQETLPEFAECQSGASVGGHIELHLPVRGAVVTTWWRYSSARRAWAMTCVVDWMVRSGMMVYAVVSWFPATPHINILLFGKYFFSKSHTDCQSVWLLFSLHSFSSTLTILIFLSKYKILKIKEF